MTPRYSRQCCTAESRGARARATTRRCAEPATGSRLAASVGESTINRADHSISYLDKLIKTGSESIEATLRADLICGVYGAHRGYETAEVRDVRRNGEGRRLCGGTRKILDGVFPGRPQSFRHQRRPVDDCSPGRAGMVQNGETRGGTFRGKMDRCRQSQDWTMACSGIPERNGKDPEEDSPKQADSCGFARPC